MELYDKHNNFTFQCQVLQLYLLLGGMKCFLILSLNFVIVNVISYISDSLSKFCLMPTLYFFFSNNLY